MIKEDNRLHLVEKFISIFNSSLIIIVKIISSIIVIFYISGFFIWNIYLSPFGVYEFSPLQTKFILSGFAFFKNYLTILIILISLFIIYFSFNWKKIRFVFFLIIFTLVFVGGPYALINFSKNIFPQIPQEWGGAKPIPIYLIINEDASSSLPLLNIGLVSSIQTTPQCLLYQNNDYMLIGVLDEKFQENKGIARRVVALDKEEFFHGIQYTGYSDDYKFSVRDIDCSIEQFYNLTKINN